MAADDKTMQERVADAMHEALVSEGEFVTKFVCIIETIDQNGDHGLWVSTSKEINSWDILGMLQWGLQHEQAGKVLRMITAMRDVDEDD